MQYLQKQYNLAILLSVIAIGFMSWQTQGTRRYEPAEPVVLVSVDFVRVFESIEESAYETSRIQAIVEEMQEEIEEGFLIIDEFDEELELYNSKQPKWHELQQGKLLASLELQAKSMYFEQRAKREESKGMRRLYEHIRTSSQELSEQNNWDYVFVNDLIVEMPEGDNVDMGVQISNRRMLYANPMLDVTDLLIEYMNSSFDEMAVRE